MLNRLRKKMRPFSSLRARLLLIVLLAVIPAFGLIAHAVNQTRVSAYAGAQRDTLDLVRRIADEQAHIVLHTHVLLLSLSHTLELTGSSAPGDCHRLLASLFEHHPYYTHLAAARPDGEVFCSTLPLSAPVNVADRDYFRRTVKTLEFTGSYDISRSSDAGTITFAFPVTGEDARLRAVVFAGLDLAWVSQRLSEAQLPEGSIVAVVDDRGRALAHHPDPDKWVGRSLAGQPVFEAVVAQRAEGTLEAVGPDNARRLYAFAPLYRLPTVTAFVWAGIPRAAVYAAVEAEFIQDSIIMGVVALLALVAAWVGSDRLVLRPMQAIAEAARRLRQGDLSARTGLSAPPGELGELARLFDAMAEGLQTRDRRIAQAAQELARTNRVLRVLGEGSQALLHAAEEPTLLQEVCRIAVAEGGYRLAWVGYAAHDGQLLPMAWVGAEPGPQDTLSLSCTDTEGGPGPMGTALRTGQPVVVQDIATDPRAASWRVEAQASGYASALALPLRVEGDVLGVFGICAEVPEVFSKEDIRLLSDLADDLALGITHLRLRRAQQQAQEALRQSEERIRLILASMGEGLFAIDRTGLCTQVNPAGLRLLGYREPSELLGRPIHDLTHHTRADGSPCSIEECPIVQALWNDRGVHSEDDVFWRADGTRFAVEYRSHPILHNGRAVGAVVTFSDITARKHNERALREREEEYRTFFELAATGHAEVDPPSGRFLRVNRRLCEITGYTTEEFLGKTLRDITHLEDRERDWTAFQQCLQAGGAEYVTEKRYLRQDGRIIWVQENVAFWHDAEGQTVRAIGVIQDITARKHAEEALRGSEERTRLLLESMGEGLFAMDRRGLCTQVNPAGVRLLGYREASELLNRPIHDLTHHTRADGSPCPMEQCQIVQALWNDRGVHCEDDVFWRPDGTHFAVEYRSHPILKNGQAVGAVVTFSDITERKVYQAQIAHLATHDALTELPNRTLFNDRTLHALAMARRTGQRVAVLFLDLDHFKIINDSLGHALGDAMLRGMGSRLRTLMREGDTVARLGGDEFGILLVDIKRAEDVVSIARKLLDAFSEPFAVNGHKLFVTMSIGASLYPSDGQDVDTLLKNADTALFRVKEQGRNGFQFYTQDMSLRAQQRLELETALRLALQRREFELHYQPRMDLRSGAVSGVEALIRWHPLDRGWVSAERIISSAEESGLILPLGEWVLQTACAQNKRWQEGGLPWMQVAVNVSGRQFWQGDICHMVERVLKETELSARDLELEVTESVIMRDAPEISRTLSHLKSSGVTISIDDFGTGYSSLSYLRRLPVDKLKIDQSFVRDITRNSDGAKLVEELINLAHALRLTVTAEGVETEEEFGFLSSHGCDEVQGYYVSEPLPPAGVQQLLQEEMLN